jgi:hypothetical protein
MNPLRLDDEDEWNTHFEPGFPPLHDHQPGFVDRGDREKDAEGQIRFPRKSKPKDVPRESLAARIAQSRKER